MLKKACKKWIPIRVLDGKAAIGTLRQSIRRDFRESATTRQCAERGRSCQFCASVLSARRTRGCFCARTSSSSTKRDYSGVHQPRVFGGMELDFVAVVDIPGELARGCPIDSLERRQPCIAPLAARIITVPKPNAKFGTQTRMRSSPHRSQACRRARAQGRRWVRRQRAAGRFPRGRQLRLEYVGRHGPRRENGKTPSRLGVSALCRKSDYTIIDTWFAMGAAATGSQGCRSRLNCFVPEYRALPLVLALAGTLDPPGAELRIQGRCSVYRSWPPSSHTAGARRAGRGGGSLLNWFLEATAKRTGYLYRREGLPISRRCRSKLPVRGVLSNSARFLLRQSALEFQAAAERSEIPGNRDKAAVSHALPAYWPLLKRARRWEVLWSC